MILIVDGLYLGNRESARDLRRLREAGITHVVNCAGELPNYHEGHLDYLAVRMADPDPNFHEHIARVCAYIDAARVEAERENECFTRYERYLRRLGVLTDETVEAAKAQALEAMRAGIAAAEALTDPDPELVTRNAYAE